MRTQIGCQYGTDRPGQPRRSRKLSGVTKGLLRDRATFFSTVPKSLHVSWHCGTGQGQPTWDRADTCAHLMGNGEVSMSWVLRRRQAMSWPLSAPRDTEISWRPFDVRNQKPPEDVNIHLTWMKTFKIILSNHRATEKGNRGTGLRMLFQSHASAGLLP